jgi:dihydrofolate reductase
LAANTWTHLAMTYDGTTLKIYVNGTLVTSTAQSGTIVASTNPLQIGGDSTYGQYFRGMIDEVRVYNIVLTQTQIQTDMATALP